MADYTTTKVGENRSGLDRRSFLKSVAAGGLIVSGVSGLAGASELSPSQLWQESEYIDHSVDGSMEVIRTEGTNYDFVHTEASRSCQIGFSLNYAGALGDSEEHELVASLFAVTKGEAYGEPFQKEATGTACGRTGCTTVYDYTPSFNGFTPVSYLSGSKLLVNDQENEVNRDIKFTSNETYPGYLNGSTDPNADEFLNSGNTCRSSSQSCKDVMLNELEEEISHEYMGYYDSPVSDSQIRRANAVATTSSTVLGLVIPGSGIPLSIASLMFENQDLNPVNIKGNPVGRDWNMRKSVPIVFHTAEISLPGDYEGQYQIRQEAFVKDYDPWPTSSHSPQPWQDEDPNNDWGEHDDSIKWDIHIPENGPAELEGFDTYSK